VTDTAETDRVAAESGGRRQTQARNALLRSRPPWKFAAVAAGQSERVRTWSATTMWGSARWQRVLAAAITGITFWPQSLVDPDIGVDPSWQAALGLARMQHLAWGPEVLFTYGPLGFLQNTTCYSFEQSVLATLYQVIVVAALFLGIVAVLRQRHPPMASIIGAFVATGIATTIDAGHGGSPLSMMMYPELAVLAAFVWAAVLLLQLEPKQSTVFTTCTALGAVAGFQMLLKFNTSFPILASALAASILLDWKAVGRHTATVIALVASTVTWWVVAGQPLGDLSTWLRYSADLVFGYSDAMSIPLRRDSATAVLWSLVWIGLLCTMFVRGRPEIPRKFVVLVGLATVIIGKAAFGRYELWHFSMLLGMVVVALAITPRVGIRDFAFATAVVVVIYYHLGGVAAIHDRAMMAVGAPFQAVDRLVTFALPGRVEQRIEQDKARQRAYYAIPHRFIETIGSRTVHIDPVEASVAWAYNLAWRPAPVFQTYQANTPALDKLNSDTLGDGPDFVLSLLDSVPATAARADVRLATQQSPLYSRTLLCNYTLSGVENRWALFARTGPHCGALTPLPEVDLDKKDPVTVPRPSAPDMVTLVAIDLHPTVTDNLFQGMIAPITAWTVVLDGVVYRLIAANAAEPFLIATPPSMNGTNLEIHPRVIEVGRARGLGQGDVRARLRFFEMRIAPQAPAG
jgi:hypothetical protein